MTDNQFERVLEVLVRGDQPSAEELSGLTHLLPEQRARLHDPWACLSTDDKLGSLVRLHQLESEDFRLDFSEFYRLGMEDPEPLVRRAAILSIVEDRSVWLEERLLSLLRDDTDVSVRAASATALGPFALAGELGETSMERAERVRAGLLAAAQGADQPKNVQREALASLGYFSDAVVQNLVGIAYGEDELRVAAIQAMGNSADEAWTDWLIRDLSSADELIREAAALASGSIEDERAVPALADLVDDPVTSVRLAAIQALGEIGGEEAREALAYAVMSDDVAIGKAARAALDAVDDAEDEP